MDNPAFLLNPNSNCYCPW